MNTEPTGFSVNLEELTALALEADVLSEAIAAAWQQDWFEDGKWPDTDPLRTAVIAYRRSLQGAMERLCGGVDKLAAHLRAAADVYRVTDARAARALTRIASGH